MTSHASCCVPVGPNWKFELDFGDDSDFSKIRIDPVMLKFLATTEGEKISKSQKSLFAILPESSMRVELSCSRQRTSIVPARVSSLGKRKP